MKKTCFSGHERVAAPLYLVSFSQEVDDCPEGLANIAGGLKTFCAKGRVL